MYIPVTTLLTAIAIAYMIGMITAFIIMVNAIMRVKK